MLDERSVAHRPFFTAWLLAAVLAHGLPATVRAGETPDPVVSEVLRMLESGVSESVVLRWLDTTDPPGEITADDLIRLRQVGASDELAEDLLARSTEPSAALEAEPTPAAEPTPEPSPKPDEVPRETAEMSAAAAAEAATEVRFELRYRTLYNPDSDPWDLYAYLDGEPLSWMQASGRVNEKRLSFHRVLSVGPHVLRLGLEIHTGREGSYRHRSRVYPRALALDVKPGPAMQVDVVLLEDGFSMREAGPLTYRVMQDVATHQFLDKEGPGFDDWPYLCDDLELAYPDGKKMPRSVRRQMETCLHWAELWPGVDGVGSRAAVLEDMARFDFHPVPRGSRILR